MIIIIIIILMISRYSDGYFDVVIKAANSPDPSKADFALIKIFVLQVVILSSDWTIHEKCPLIGQWRSPDTNDGL